jgi:Dolichyl-phosphate-mannose-protein mannosyltransferase
MSLGIRIRPLWLLIAAFLAVQVTIIWFGANGPFVDEGLYTVAGLRVLEGQGRADGYLAWFNGSPFVWPVMAALGHQLGGLAGARLVAAIVSTLTVLAFAKTAETLFGESAAAWGTAALCANGLFMALAHFAVYDVPALAGVAVSMWCVARASRSDGWTWVIGAAVAFAFAVISKYGYLPMGAPLVGLLVSGRGRADAGRALAVFASAAGVILVGYSVLCFESLVPTSVSAYLDQPHRAGRRDIAVHQLVYALGPLALAGVGAAVAWRQHRRGLAVTCLMALSLCPAFHLWTGNFVSSQKHAVPGFLFAYLLAGVGLAHVWSSRWRVAPVVGLALLMLWGGLQWYWQEHSWSDSRTIVRHLEQHIRRGERVVADSAWTYALALYPKGLVASPFDVIDAKHEPALDGVDLCQIPWLIGNGDRGDRIGRAVGRCGHQRALSAATQHYYFDAARLRRGTYTVVVELYRRPAVPGVNP